MGLRRMKGAVTLLKTANGRMKTSRSRRAPILVCAGSGDGGKHDDGGLDDGRVVGAERRDDGVEQVGAVVIRYVLPRRGKEARSWRVGAWTSVSWRTARGAVATPRARCDADVRGTLACRCRR